MRGKNGVKPRLKSKCVSRFKAEQWAKTRRITFKIALMHWKQFIIFTIISLYQWGNVVSSRQWEWSFGGTFSIDWFIHSVRSKVEFIKLFLFSLMIFFGFIRLVQYIQFIFWIFRSRDRLKFMAFATVPAFISLCVYQFSIIYTPLLYLSIALLCLILSSLIFPPFQDNFMDKFAFAAS